MSKAVKAGDLRAKTDDQLKDELLQLRREQMNLRFQKVNGQLEGANPSKSIRKSIARIKTVQNQKSAQGNKLPQEKK